MISTPDGSNRPVLLLGGTGRLGRMLCRFWPTRADLRVQSRGAGGDLRFDPLADGDALRAAAQDVRAVVCLAGVTDAHAARTGDAMALNSALALAAIEAAPPDTRVLLASSAAVYGALPGVLAEDGPTAPRSDYGRAKLAMEAAALATGHPVTALRIGNVAGADAILGGWRAGMQLDRFADGRTPARSYIGPRTLARAVHALTCAEAPPAVINIAAPGSVEMGALLDAAGLAWQPRPAPDTAIATVTLATDRLAHHLSFAPEDGTAAGLVAEWHAMRQTP